MEDGAVERGAARDLPVVNAGVDDVHVAHGDSSQANAIGVPSSIKERRGEGGGVRVVVSMHLAHRYVARQAAG